MDDFCSAALCCPASSLVTAAFCAGQAEGASKSPEIKIRCQEILRIKVKLLGYRGASTYVRAHESGSLALPPHQFFAQINHLPHVMIGVRRASQENRETIPGILFSFGAIWQAPIRVRLLGDGGLYHYERVVKSFQQLLLWLAAGIGELQVAVSNVSILGNLRAHIVVEVSRNVQQQMANAISVGIGAAPYVVVGKRGHQIVYLTGNSLIVPAEIQSRIESQIRHV